MTLINDWLQLFLNIIVSALPCSENQIVSIQKNGQNRVEYNQEIFGVIFLKFFLSLQEFHAILSRKM